MDYNYVLAIECVGDGVGGGRWEVCWVGDGGVVGESWGCGGWEMGGVVVGDGVCAGW